MKFWAVVALFVVAAGLCRARDRGVQLGRPRAVVDIERARELRASGVSYRRIGEALGVGKDALRAALKEGVRGVREA